MFKLSRNNAGDARDVAALRAAVFDELTGLWNKSASEVAEDSLKLGGRAAALYALLTDLDTLKSTYFSGTSAKDSLKLGGSDAALYALLTSTVAAANKLAIARTINGVAFDGTANVTIPVSVIDGQSSRTILVKSGRIITTNSVGVVTFSSAFPNQLLFAAYHLESSGPFLAASGTTTGIQMVAATAGWYNWIAWGY